MFWKRRGEALARREAFIEPAALQAMRDAIIESPYLSENPLNYRFTGTLGFSVIFRAEGLPQVRQHFPSFAAYLDALDPTANAYYLNPLIVCSGASVARHVDRTLRSCCKPFTPAPPRQVNVLYLEVPPDMDGGELRLYNGDQEVATIRPVENLLLTFRGDLAHEVAEARYADDGARRISLVCEQYHMNPLLLRRIPRFTIRSRSSFDNFLEAELDRDV